MARGTIELCSFWDYFRNSISFCYLQKLKGGKIVWDKTILYWSFECYIVPGVFRLVFTEMKLVTSSTDWLYHRSKQSRGEHFGFAFVVLDIILISSLEAHD